MVALVVLVMDHVMHHKQMDPWRLYQVDPANVDANTCKVFPYVTDMVCMQKNTILLIDLIVFKKLRIRIL